MVGIFKNFNIEFFKNQPSSIPYKIEWFDIQGGFILDDSRVVSITLCRDNDMTGYNGIYNGYTVEIVNKYSGKVISKWFPFDYYLEQTAEPPSNLFFPKKDGNKPFDWVHNNKPKDTNQLVVEIFKWIELFK
jgi:hypothetical protein